jgi:choline transporter-like protein 2/4/5
MVKQCAGIIVWFSILATIVGLIGGGFYLNDYSKNMPDDGSSTKTWVKYGSYALWAFGGIFSLMILCLFNSIRVATAVMKTSAVFIAHNLRTILVPLFGFVFTAAFLTFWVIDAAYLASAGEVKASTGGSQWKELVWNDNLRYFMIYLFFGLLWILAMIISCTQFVVIVAACVWYFTSTSDTRGKASLLKGMHWMFRYNFGSLAFGSLLLALIWFAIIIFEYIQKKLNGSGGQ